MPTLDDPMIVTARDGTLFVCWVEIVGTTRPHPRWFAVSDPPIRYNVGPYAGETSPQAIRALICDWWDGLRAMGHPRTVRELRDALAASLDEDPSGYVYLGGPADGERFVLEPGFRLPDRLENEEIWPGGDYRLDRERKRYVWHEVNGGNDGDGEPR